MRSMARLLWKLAPSMALITWMCRWSPRGLECSFVDLRRTGETPWVKEIIRKYHNVAERNGAIVGHFWFCIQGDDVQLILVRCFLKLDSRAPRRMS